MIFVFSKEISSEIHKELQQIKIGRHMNKTKKGAKNLNRFFTKADIYLPVRSKNKSPSLVIRKLQIKTTIQYISTDV